MNILFCDPQKVRHLGTASSHIYEVASGLIKMGHNVVFINVDPPKSEAEINASVQLSLWEHIKSRLFRSRIIRPLGGEITILWLFLRGIYIFLLAFMTIMRRKEKFDVIYRRHGLFNTECLLAKMFKIISVKEVNGIVTDETKVSKWGNKISLQIMNQVESFNMPKADKIIVVTSKLKEVLQKDYGVPGDKIVVIPNGANTDLFKPIEVIKAREELGLNRSDNYICFIGSLWQYALKEVKWKGRD